MPNITLIAACNHYRVIGLQGKIPWHLPNDFAHFKRVTMGKPIVMGRKTHQSIGRALPGRHNIVLSRQKSCWPNCSSANSLDEAIALCGDAHEIMVIGGSTLYQEALPKANKIILTLVDHHDKDGDAFFPEINDEQWHRKQLMSHPADERHSFAFMITEYQKTY
jgi:dihydrofolate reductase